MNRKCRYTLLLTLASIILITGCASPPSSSKTPTVSFPEPQGASASLILATFAPRQVIGVDTDGVTQFGDFDFDHLPALIEAGINEIIAPIEFMSKDTGLGGGMNCDVNLSHHSNLMVFATTILYPLARTMS